MAVSATFERVSRRLLLVFTVALALLAWAADAATACVRPYSATSPWNVPIEANPAYRTDSRDVVAAIGGPLTSDPTQYTYPVYEAGASTPVRSVSLSGWFSNVTAGGLELSNQRGGTVAVPIPAGAAAAAGTDSQIVIVDPVTGSEWGFWQLYRDASGNWKATNGYRYSTTWSGVPPTGFVSRGAGVPYLIGLVRPCEIERGRIDHALAFAYDYPSGEHIYPATKSDGKGTGVSAVPEGTRFQLDPTRSEAEIRAWGCTGPCLTIAKALQRYGMYVIDNAGRPKVMMEYEDTANWDGIVTSRTVSAIPLTAFKVIARNTPPVKCTIRGTAGSDRLTGTATADVICGFGGDDVVVAGGGNDVVYPGRGNDVVYAKAGRDRVFGSDGSDRVYGGGSADSLSGGRDADSLAGGDGGDALWGGTGKDLLSGGAGADALYARDGQRDRLYGGPNSDRSRADRGLDVVRAVESFF